MTNKAAKVAKAPKALEDDLIKFAKNTIEARKCEAKSRKCREENKEIFTKVKDLFKKNAMIQAANFLFKIGISGRTSVPYKQLYEEMLDTMDTKSKNKWINRCNALTSGPDKEVLEFIEMQNLK